MSKRVLVAYGSKYGATAGIAEKIGEVLQAAGYQVQVANAKTIRSITEYDAVVLGSAVYIGLWRAEAANLLKRNESALASKPVWLFSSGPAGEGDAATLLEGWRFPTALAPIAERIKVRDITTFHGAVQPEKMNFIEKWMMKNVNSPVGDYRDWQAIQVWAKSIADSLATNS